MTTKSSIHFAKCRPGGQPERHNFRQYSAEDYRPKYFLPPEYQQPNIYKDLLETDATAPAEAGAAEEHARGFYDDLKAQYSGRGKRPKYENCRREAILNLSDDSTEADVMNVVKYLKDRWHITVTSYAIHRDEGYIDKADGSVHRNLHAHLILDSLYLDTQTGKPKQAWREIKISDLRTIQDDIAKIMGMERTRGQGRARAHLDRKTYKAVKEERDQAEQLRNQAAEHAAKAKDLITKAQEATAAIAAEADRAEAAKRQAAQEKAEADKKAAEIAKQAEQVRHDIEVHKLHPSGLLVNRALRDANAQQAEQIDKLHQQAAWQAAKHKQDLADKDKQIQLERDNTEDKRQIIGQLRATIADRDATIAEQAETIKQQEETIKEQSITIKAYEKISNMLWDIIDIYKKSAIAKAYDEAVKVTEKAFEKVGGLGNVMLELWDRAMHHKEREAAEEAKRQAEEKAAQARAEAAERQRQAEEAKRNRSRGYGR